MDALLTMATLRNGGIVSKVLWRARPSGGTALRPAIRIFAAGNGWLQLQGTLLVLLNVPGHLTKGPNSGEENVSRN